ncbi:reverse transcriptase-like protein [Alkalihalobacillus trypoxylicola]|uniref:Ribonuclease H n=1 Tax=Alkalihalobacillus trypoxylicola TaxID=519424 RepID=A0A161P4J6_9BACI|nr:reverse transcriptase-like protein [Alkalihalobacillus trypoxylicola]KYG25556.1 ribonuclease H [Alkalihalobacillus trypoxylicola]GAF66650.1 ribonuclease H [Bacillus sp. TS-2]
MVVEVYIDGASAGNPGPSGAGVLINFKNGKVEEFSKSLSIMSNHEAEYEALLFALNLCLQKEIKMASFRTDSQLIEQAIERRYVKNRQFQKYLNEALIMIDQFDLFFIKWIPSQSNKKADQLAKNAIKR